jgi:hypothetical protein
MYRAFVRAMAASAFVLSALSVPGCDDDDDAPWPIDSSLDCKNLPVGPFTSELFLESDLVRFADDLAFDGQGHFALIDEEHIVLVDADAKTELVPLDAPFEDRTKGVRYTRDGRLLVAWNLAHRVMQVFPDGSVRTWLKELVMPKQIYPDFEDNVWLSEFSYYKLGEEISTDRLSRVTLDGTMTTIAQGGLAHEPKGVVYDERRRALFFVAGDGMELVVGRVDIAKDGTPGDPIAIHKRPGATGEGIAMDGCGNLYVIDAMFTTEKENKSRLLRLHLDEQGDTLIRPGPDGRPEGVVDEVARFAGWVNNFQFGSGPGFSPTTVYGTGFLETGVFSVDVGLPGAPVPVPDFTKVPAVPAMGPDEPIDLEFCEFEVTVNYTGTQTGWLSVTSWDEWPPSKQDIGLYEKENPVFPYTDIVPIIKPYTPGDPITVMARLDTVALIEEPFAEPLLTSRSSFQAVDCDNPPTFTVTLQDSYGACPGETGKTSTDADSACSGPGESCLDLNAQSVNASLCASVCTRDIECPVATADGTTAAVCKPIGEKSYCVIPCTTTGDCPTPGAACEPSLGDGICVFPTL